MTTTHPVAHRHDDERSRAQQLLTALVRDLQRGLGRLNPLRAVEVPPAAVDRSADRLLGLFREVSRAEAREVLLELLAELDAADLDVIARTAAQPDA